MTLQFDNGGALKNNAISSKIIQIVIYMCNNQAYAFPYYIDVGTNDVLLFLLFMIFLQYSYT